jgi:two-component system sensor histidine kinase ChvG
MVAENRNSERAIMAPPPLRSLVAKLILLALVFVTVPIILYREFSQADREKQQLLLRGIHAQGRLVAAALEPVLRQTDPSTLLDLGDRIGRYTDDGTAIKVLYRPAEVTSAEGFFFIASAPPVPSAYLSHQRDQLLARGILTKLAETCAGDVALAMRYVNPGGAEEMLTSITPVHTPVGCWVVVTSQTLDSLLATSVGQPYWKTLEIRFAAAIYVSMGMLAILLLLGIWRSIYRFGRLARDIRTNGAADHSFAAQNRVPEFAGVAAEFDRMIKTLRDSALSLRRAAEDNAHAFKTPIAIIRQSIVPLRRIVPGDNARGGRAVEAIEQSVDRLDELVSYSRWMDEETAELLDPPRESIDLSELCGRVLNAYGDVIANRRLRLTKDLERNLSVRGGEELLETVIENVIDNAIGFAPPDSAIQVALKHAAGNAELTVTDRGPGIDPANAGRIFERYYSDRGRHADDGDGAPTAGTDDPKNLGIGLWIVRRNVQAIGGSVSAENHPDGGLALRILLPLAA